MERKKRKEKQGKDKKKERQVRQGKEKKRNERKVNKRKKEQYSSLSVLSPSTPATGYQAPPPIFIDGWWDGMGWGGRSTFFFGPYLENYFIIFLNCFRSLKYLFLHIFWNIREKKSECSFFQKISSKSGVDFFFDFLNINSQISRKQLDIFFWLFLVPSEEFLRHLLRKNQKK